MFCSVTPIATLRQHAAAADLPSYRCRTRPYQQACEMDPALDGFIQLKARNAADALIKARLIAHRDDIVIEVERLDR